MTESRGERWHREAQKHAVRDGMALFATIVVGWTLYNVVGVALCSMEYPHPTTTNREVVEMDARDIEYVEPPRQSIGKWMREQIDTETYRELEYDIYGSDYIEDTYCTEHVQGSGLDQYSGVNYHDGRTETYYSSNVLYHYRTDEWTVDSEGFYRTDEGYYVVAASDMEQGTVFEGSKGECIVLDSGCAEGVTDYYVAW